MLIENLIKLTLEMQGFRIESVKMDVDLFVVVAPDRRFKPRCGVCGSPGRYRDTVDTRRFRHVPLWGIAVYLVYAPRRVICPGCGGIHVEAFPWAKGKHRLTTAFACFLAGWAKLLPWTEVARLFKCAWGTVDSAVRLVVEYGLAHRDLSNLRSIGVDEISRKKGHVYLTNIYDLDTRKLIWSGEERTEKTLQAFFDFLGQERSTKIQGVCCDMWDPYIQIIKKNAPQAILVFDKFHIVRHLMDAVDKVRREEILEKGREHKELMAKSRYIWLKNPWNLTDKQSTRFSVLEKLNLKIHRAYLLKESFRQFWTYRVKGWAARFLQQWFWWATHSRLEPMRDFAWLLRRHEENILSYFKMPITNGTVEGLNNKAKMISHRAYGFRSAATYIRNLYHCMADLPMPKSLHSFV
jgi:transposase